MKSKIFYVGASFFLPVLVGAAQINGATLGSPADALAAIGSMPAIPAIQIPASGNHVASEQVRGVVSASVNGRAAELLAQGKTREALAYAVDSYKKDAASAYLLGRLVESGIRVGVDGSSELNQADTAVMQKEALGYYKFCHPQILECTYNVARIGQINGDPSATSLMRLAAMHGNPSAMSAYGAFYASQKNPSKKFIGAKWLWAASLLGDKNAEEAFNSLGLSDRRAREAKASAKLMAERAKKGSAVKQKRRAKSTESSDLDPFSRALKQSQEQ